ncbi:hypothetical protein KC842_01715, partial [Candidatus Nomurabacteria bacterium]|nr:hypothetical protein [Candidatus Nomurabacteria bacterium]
PQEILDALSEGKISEGHTRPLLMLSDRPEEQTVLFKEIIYKKITVREAEKIARSVANDKVRKKEYIIDPEIGEMEQKFQDALGTRVHIEKRANGGKIEIDFFTNEDLSMILEMLSTKDKKDPYEMLKKFEEKMEVTDEPKEEVSENTQDETIEQMDDRSEEEKKKEDDQDLYDLSNFSL